MASIQSLIKKSPSWIQKIYYNIVPFSQRYGKVFTETYNFLLESEKWSREKLEQYQLEEFKKLINHCYTNVPYYKKVFDDRGLTPNDFNSISDITKLPFLTKDIIRENLNDLIAKNMKDQKSYEFRTSGSTGKKLVFYATDDVYKKEAAFVLRSYEKHGAHLYDKPSVWLRRYVPVDRNSDLWYYDYELNRLYMSAYHLNDDTIEDYISKINSKKYHTLVAYPSSIYVLACLCEKHKLKLDTIQKIHVSSEMMLPEWRKKIIEVFGIVPVAHYGAIEKVCFMHQLEHSEKYYENLQYGVTEYIDQGDGTHTIVGTGFLNYYMPFLRYKTEDSVVLNSNPGDFDKVYSINGRTSDILIAEDGSQLPGVNFYSWIDKKVPGVSMFQIVQKSRKDVTFSFVGSNQYSEKTISEIKEGLTSRLGNLNFTITKVREIKRNETTGKIRCIVNNILSSYSSKELYDKLYNLKKQNGTHSPSINTIIENIPEIQCNIDACFLSNPYATDLFLKRFNQDLIVPNNIRNYLELYPQQNKFISKKISEYIGIPSENILIGNGAIEIIEKVMNNMVGKILIGLPTFSSYYEFNKDCEIVKSEKKLDSVENVVSEVRRTSSNNLLLVNPNNPTGHYIVKEDLKNILTQLKDLDTIIVDESFIHFATKDNPNDASIGEFVLEYPNLVVIKSMSKDFGIAGIRCGYAIMSKEKVKLFIDKGFLWNSNGISEYFFNLLSDKSFIVEYEKTRIKFLEEFEEFFEELNKLKGIEVYESKTNFFLIDLKTKKSFDFMCWMLIEKGIYVRCMDDKIGMGIDSDTFVRIAGKTREENSYIIQSIKEFIGEV
jgi:histidinol-phosphate/aromatic aminotransferase/cobyric acid decarboxylase-like protein/phenylacetate-coenzyme A ligase PaaK-like adenylate-forming protein